MKKSRIQQVSMEVTVGAFMFMVLMVLGMMTIILSSENIFTKHYHHEVIFTEAMGLSDGDNVLVRGVRAGQVKHLWLADDGVHVKMSLEKELTLYRDYEIKILPSSLLGGKYVLISEGTKGEAVVPKGSVLQGVTPLDFIAELSIAVEQLKDVAIGLREGKGTLGKLLNDDAIYNDLEQIGSNLREVSGRLVNGEGTIGKLLQKDDELYQNLTGAAASMRELSESLNGGQGSMGKFLKDDELYNEVTSLLVEIRAAVDDLRETAPITTFSSLFFGAF